MQPSYCATHGPYTARCPGCAPPHVCAVTAVPEAVGIAALVDILRSTTSASAVVARLAIRGMAIAKVEGRR